MHHHRTGPTAHVLRNVAAIATAVLLALCVPARATPPCLLPSDAMLNELLVSPPDGATDVGTNARALVVMFDGDVAPARVRANGVELPQALDRVALTDGFGSRPFGMVRALPDFPALSQITVDHGEGSTLHGFATGPGADTTAPAAPELGESRPWSDGACTPFVEIDIGELPDATAFVARRDEPPVLDDGAEIHGISWGGSIVVAGPGSTDAEVFVSALDATGNLGEARSVMASFPADYAWPACSHEGTLVPSRNASGASILLLLALLRCRRQRRSTTRA